MRDKYVYNLEWKYTHFCVTEKNTTFQDWNIVSQVTTSEWFFMYYMDSDQFKLVREPFSINQQIFPSNTFFSYFFFSFEFNNVGISSSKDGSAK